MKIIISVLVILCLCGSCGTIQENVIVQTKIVIPSFNCPVPHDYKDKMKSLIDSNTEGDLIAIISYNVIILQQNNAEWVEYYNCIQKILKNYEQNIKPKKEEK